MRHYHCVMNLQPPTSRLINDLEKMTWKTIELSALSDQFADVTYCLTTWCSSSSLSLGPLADVVSWVAPFDKPPTVRAADCTSAISTQ
jgi:hypothetical protein